MRHRLSAAWLIALALLMKMLVPTGYMIGTATGSLTIELCPSYAPGKVAASMPGMSHHQDAGTTPQTSTKVRRCRLALSPARPRARSREPIRCYSRRR